MQILSEEIIHFLQKQGFVIVSTVDKHGHPHSACKGIVEINDNGKILLLDLYKRNTYENLKSNSNISLTAVDEHKFRGYCLKGKAKMVDAKELESPLLRAWEDKIINRISHRVLKNIKGEKGHPTHPEVFLPKPMYLIVVEVKEVIDLTPRFE